MHNEQIEAVVEATIERYFGDVQVLVNMREALRQSNVSLIKEGQSADVAKSANLVQSLLISHTNLAEATGKAMAAFQTLDGRIERIEQAAQTIKEALLDLHRRVEVLEGRHQP